MAISFNVKIVMIDLLYFDYLLVRMVSFKFLNFVNIVGYVVLFGLLNFINIINKTVAIIIKVVTINLLELK